ncbi:MAG: hypothetical protein ACK5LK_00835 [Chthoniobacterales bacterium]
MQEDELNTLEKIADTIEDPQERAAEEEGVAEEFDMLRERMELLREITGLNVDLSDLDLTQDPMEFEQKLFERFQFAAQEFEKNPASKPTRRRKPTKAQLKREEKQKAIDAAKNRDLKTLYKQLAKVLHPDLETDSTLKTHKENWMKRLTTAYASNDLRELLCIEMEWLGEESSNLADAGDEKLQVYNLILKEQIAEVREKTRGLKYSPKYSVLSEYANPYTGGIVSLATIKKSFQNEIDQVETMLAEVKTDASRAKRIVIKWIEEYAKAPW